MSITKRHGLSVVTIQDRNGSWTSCLAGSGAALGSLIHPLNTVLEEGAGTQVCIYLTPVNFFQVEADASVVFHGFELVISHIRSSALSLHFDILAQTGQLVLAGGSEALERFKTRMLPYKGSQGQWDYVLMCESWGGSEPRMPNLADAPHAPSFTAIHKLTIYGGGDWVPHALPLPQGAVVGPKPPVSKQ